MVIEQVGRGCDSPRKKIMKKLNMKVMGFGVFFWKLISLLSWKYVGVEWIGRERRALRGKRNRKRRILGVAKSVVQRTYLNISNHFTAHDLKAVSTEVDGTARAGEVSGASIFRSLHRKLCKTSSWPCKHSTG